MCVSCSTCVLWQCYIFIYLLAGSLVHTCHGVCLCVCVQVLGLVMPSEPSETPSNITEDKLCECNVCGECDVCECDVCGECDVCVCDVWGV